MFSDGEAPHEPQECRGAAESSRLGDRDYAKTGEEFVEVSREMA